MLDTLMEMFISFIMWICKLYVRIAVAIYKWVVSLFKKEEVEEPNSADNSKDAKNDAN